MCSQDLVARNKALAETKQSLLVQIKKLFEQLQAEKVIFLVVLQV